MARTGVTYKQVEQAAEELLAEGKRPTIERIRRHLGETGSFGTIAKHLNDWRSDSMPITSESVDTNDSDITYSPGMREQIKKEAAIEIEKFKKQVHEQFSNYKHQASKAQQENEDLRAQLAQHKQEQHKLELSYQELVQQLAEKEQQYNVLAQENKRLNSKLQQLQDKQIEQLNLDLNNAALKGEDFYKLCMTRIEQQTAELKSMVARSLSFYDKLIISSGENQEHVNHQFQIILDLLAEKYAGGQVNSL